MKPLEKLTKAQFISFCLMAFCSGVMIGIGGTASGTADASLAALLFTVNIQPGQTDDHGHDRDDDDTFPHIVYSLKLNESQRPVFWFRFSAFFQP